MAAELLIRPGRQDHLVVADLLAPGGARGLGARPPIHRLVLDAPIAAARPQFAEDARAAGLPVMVDPLTFLLQGDTDPDNGWTLLPYGRSDACSADAFDSPQARRALVASVVDFQLAQGASVIVPPYFAAASSTDRWFELSLLCIAEAAQYLTAIGVRLPMTPVLTGRLDHFARPVNFETGLDRFASAAMAAGSQTVAAQLGPAGAPSDNYAKVLRLMQAALRLRRPGLGVQVWRQGAYGPALVAAGLQGYETGISAGEATDLASYARNRRPVAPTDQQQEDAASGGGGGAVYLPALGRSVSRKVVDVLHANLSTRALIVCDDAVRCCPHGMESTLGGGRRAHAIRSRARYLAELEQMPANPRWRLYKVAQDARAAAHLVATTRPILVAAGLPPLRAAAYEALAAAADHLRGESSAVA